MQFAPNYKEGQEKKKTTPHHSKEIMEDLKKQKQQQQCSEKSKKKERHIVTWTQEEDNILREQINIHGIENWAIVASKFKDKTTRQCRRRWYTYLNSDFKKGGWTPEEDMLLCEAQKKFGNRWTEIAKVVPGRTDNAVKNRFTTLCKKREKHEALGKENSIPYINSNNKRINYEKGCNTDATSESALPIQKIIRRAHIPDSGKAISYGDRSHLRNQQPRAPFAVLAQNSHNVINLPDRRHPVSNPQFNNPGQNNKIPGTFLKKDDPKINVLMRQAELLSSLAQNVDKENMGQSVENTWKVLQEYIHRTNGSDITRRTISDLQFDDFKDMIEGMESSNQGGQPCKSKMELYEDSPASSEYSTGSTLLPQSTGDNLEHSLLHQDIGTEMKAIQLGDQREVIANADQDLLPHRKEQINTHGIVFASSKAEFSYPLLATPIFRSLASGIPSPLFPESSTGDYMEHSLHQDIGTEMKATQLGDEKEVNGEEKVVLSTANVDQDMLPDCDEQINTYGIVSASSKSEFSSPLHTTPIFRSLAAGVPSPQFSESERNFLRKTLGVESPPFKPSPNMSQSRPCKRVLHL